MGQSVPPIQPNRGVPPPPPPDYSAIVCGSCYRTRDVCECDGRQARIEMILVTLAVIAFWAAAVVWLFNLYARPARAQCPSPPPDPAPCYTAADLAPYCGAAAKVLRVRVVDTPRGLPRPLVTLIPGEGCAIGDSIETVTQVRNRPIATPHEAMKRRAWPDSTGRATFGVRLLDYLVVATSLATIDSIDNATGFWADRARLPVLGVVPLVRRIHAAELLAAGDTLDVDLRFPFPFVAHLAAAPPARFR